MEDDFLHGPADSAERYNGPLKKRPLSAETKKSYFEARRQRLENIQPSISITSSIFKGVWVYFEGYTSSLSSLHLKKLVQSNGGNCTPYFSVKRITHIVCTNLSASKRESLIKRMESQNKRKIHTVKSDWILESIRVNKRLSESEYAVLKTNHEKVDKFLHQKPKKVEIEHNNHNMSPKKDKHPQNPSPESKTPTTTITTTTPSPQTSHFQFSSPSPSSSSSLLKNKTTSLSKETKTPTVENIQPSQTTSTVDRGNKIVLQMQKILQEQKPTQSLLKSIPKAQRIKTTTKTFDLDPQFFTAPTIRPTPK